MFFCSLFWGLLRVGFLALLSLFATVTGLRLECVMIDVLHTVDLGIAAHIVANIMWLIASKRGNSEAEARMSNYRTWIVI